MLIGVGSTESPNADGPAATPIPASCWVDSLGLLWCRGFNWTPPIVLSVLELPCLVVDLKTYKMLISLLYLDT